ncbi:hypothetical protein WJX73_000081 [Symbiochloris irregularis]|uniref:Uncharacterized protein n=1 Tax=Symbiochloris irregularis TaxID=706552 RepID=A0AAW1PBP2_9CHLO
MSQVYRLDEATLFKLENALLAVGIDGLEGADFVNLLELRGQVAAQALAHNPQDRAGGIERLLSLLDPLPHGAEYAAAGTALVSHADGSRQKPRHPSIQHPTRPSIIACSSQTTDQGYSPATQADSEWTGAAHQLTNDERSFRRRPFSPKILE